MSHERFTKTANSFFEGIQRGGFGAGVAFGVEIAFDAVAGTLQILPSTHAQNIWVTELVIASVYGLTVSALEFRKNLHRNPNQEDTNNALLRGRILSSGICGLIERAQTKTLTEEEQGNSCIQRFADSVARIQSDRRRRQEFRGLLAALPCIYSTISDEEAPVLNRKIMDITISISQEDRPHDNVLEATEFAAQLHSGFGLQIGFTSDT